ncbi:MAG: ROK family protein [Candidatus Omnitrophica bacterium]|nr:ROK family protein [Candidatus Omnitrophota bacterium]
MAKTKYQVKQFTISPADEKKQTYLDIYNTIRDKREMATAEHPDSEAVEEYFNELKRKNIITKRAAGEGAYEINAGRAKLAGVGFSADDCTISLTDLSGKLISKESFKVDALHHIKGKNKDIKHIVAEITEKSSLAGEGCSFTAVAVPTKMMELNPKSADILAKGINELFACDGFIVPEATAAGYAEKTSKEKLRNREILYLHSDIGVGVVIKGESIYEAKDASNGNHEEYLRPWGQFDIVSTAVSLVSKGVGTDIVKMVDGDVDSITLPLVLDAAEKGDELAQDLTKRTALALGVRLAYLINMFGVKTAVLGGGTETATGKFMEYVSESSGKFLLENTGKELEVLPASLGKEASSLGAAGLIRREIFTEVLEV